MFATRFSRTGRQRLRTRGVALAAFGAAASFPRRLLGYMGKVEDRARVPGIGCKPSLQGSDQHRGRGFVGFRVGWLGRCTDPGWSDIVAECHSSSTSAASSLVHRRGMTRGALLCLIIGTFALFLFTKAIPSRRLSEAPR